MGMVGMRREARSVCLELNGSIAALVWVIAPLPLSSLCFQTTWMQDYVTILNLCEPKKKKPIRNHSADMLMISLILAPPQHSKGV